MSHCGRFWRLFGVPCSQSVNQFARIYLIFHTIQLLSAFTRKILMIKNTTAKHKLFPERNVYRYSIFILFLSFTLYLPLWLSRNFVNTLTHREWHLCSIRNCSDFKYSQLSLKYIVCAYLMPTWFCEREKSDNFGCRCAVASWISWNINLRTNECVASYRFAASVDN